MISHTTNIQIQRAAIKTRKNRRIKNSFVTHNPSRSSPTEYSHSQNNILAVMVTIMMTDGVWNGEVAWSNSVTSGVGVMCMCMCRVQGPEIYEMEEGEERKSREIRT